MKTPLHSLILFIIAGMLTAVAGCTSVSVERQLRAAEAMMVTRPDSALTLLKAIPRAELSGERRARHALLLSQAYDKNYIDIAHDSLISIAFDFYSRPSAPDRYRIPAHYYKATVAFNANDYPTAIFNAIVADTLAAIAGDLHYRGMANNLIALSYRQIADFEKELQYAERSYEHFCQNNDSTRSRLVLMNIGVCHLELGEPEKALEIFLRPDCTKSYRHIAQCFLELDRMPEFHKVVEEHPELKTSARLNFQHAMKLIKDGRYAEADTIIHIFRHQSSTATDSMEYLVAKGELYHATGQWQKFSENVIKANHTVNNWLRKVYSEYDSQGQIQARDYIHRLVEARDNQHRHTLILTVGILTILLLIVIIIMVVMRLKHVNRLHQQELTIKDVLRENSLSQDRLRAMDGNINRLQSELSAVHDKFTALSASYQSLISAEKAKDLEHLVGKITSSLRDLCTCHQRTSSTDTAALDRIMKEIRALLTHDTIHSLEKHTDIMYSGLITRSRKAGLTNKEILLICLVMLGFSNPEIVLLTGATYSSVASRKSRLMNRLVAEGIISPDDKKRIF